MTGEIRCACGREFQLAAHLAKHLPACLGPTPTLEDIYRLGRVTVERDCLVWHGKRNGYGYGLLADIATVQAGERRAHRAAYRIAIGPIPDGLRVLHHCDNPPCVRIEHLYAGTARDNVRDMEARGRYAGRFQPVPRETRICPVCGNTFQARPGDKTKLDSPVCKAKWTWIVAPVRQTRQSTAEIRTCTICADTFHVARASIRKRTCGKSECVGAQRWQSRRSP